MSKTVTRVGTALVAASFACASPAFAQGQRPGGAPAAPHISAPAPQINAAPHVNVVPHIPAPAPHFSAAPHINAAPRVSATPYIGTPRLSAAPRASAHAFTPRSVAPHNVTPHNFARSTVRGTATRGDATRHAFQQHGRTVGGVTAHNTGGRNLARSRGGPNAAPGQGNQATRSRPNGAHLTTLSRPLGERNRNFADRRRFFDERRRFHHGGFVGWFGPVFWPYAYDDVFDYAFYPYEYDDYGFWATAYDDLLAGVFWSPGSEDIYASTGAPQGRRGRGHGRARAVDQAYRAAAATCRADEPGLTQWPIEEIAQVVQPAADQQKLLDGLKAASEHAVEVLRTACPNDQPSTPIGRLDAITSRLDAMLQAIDIVRPALDKFYASLSDEQKARFNALGQEQAGAGDRTGTAAKSQARLCDDQAPGGLTVQAIDRIKREVRPSGGQLAALDELRDAAAKAADELRDACPTQTPITPPARLDAMRTHLQAMRDAVETVRPALARFYASLSDEQKAHFNRLRPQQG
jgi:LTXXQ motif family protein